MILTNNIIMCMYVKYIIHTHIYIYIYILHMFSTYNHHIGRCFGMGIKSACHCHSMPRSKYLLQLERLGKTGSGTSSNRKCIEILYIYIVWTSSVMLENLQNKNRMADSTRTLLKNIGSMTSYSTSPFHQITFSKFSYIYIFISSRDKSS